MAAVEPAADAPSLDSPAVRAARKAAEDQLRFWTEHHAELLDRYPDQFVAVVNNEVVATSSDLLQVVQALEAKGLEPRRAWVRFITADPRRYLL